MKTIIIDYKNINKIADNLTLCLGYFDGVHLGHQKLLREASDFANNKIGLLTFVTPVASFLNNHKTSEVLTSLDDRFRIVSRYDCDYFLALAIDKSFIELSALDFIYKILIPMGVKKVVVGKDYRFGKNATGDFNLLKQFFDVRVVDLFTKCGGKVSTSNIVKLIKDGDIKEANALLGHNYEISGTIIEGFHRGHQLGFPTANLDLKTNYVIPRFGVYKCICYIGGIPRLCIANIGLNPTFGDLIKPSIEVHIPSYNGEDYGKVMYLEFLDFIRPEKSFASPNELKEQISIDLLALK